MINAKNLGLVLGSVLLTLAMANFLFWIDQKWAFLPKFPLIYLQYEQDDMEGVKHFKERFAQDAERFHSKYLPMMELPSGESEKTFNSSGIFNGYPHISDNVKIRSLSKLFPSERIVFDVNYTMDEHSRRRTVPENPGAKKTILLMGDSFTFGEGVNDDETYASFLAQRVPDARVLNLGIPGSGPNDFLDINETHLQKLLGDIKGDVTVVFSLIYEDIDRAVCEFECFNHRSHWVLDKTRYELVGDKLISEGKFRDQAIKVFFMNMLVENSLVKYLNVRIPPTLWAEDARLAARILKEIEGRLMKYLKVKKFVVAYMPYGGQRIFRRLNSPLSELGLAIWDFTPTKLGQIIPGKQDIPINLHPTPEAHDIYSMMLEEKLKAEGF